MCINLIIDVSILHTHAALQQLQSVCTCMYMHLSAVSSQVFVFLSPLFCSIIMIMSFKLWFVNLSSLRCISRIYLAFHMGWLSFWQSGGATSLKYVRCIFSKQFMLSLPTSEHYLNMKVQYNVYTHREWRVEMQVHVYNIAINPWLLHVHVYHVQWNHSIMTTLGT